MAERSETVGGGMENNGTEGARGPIGTTIYRQLLLSVMVTDESFDRTKPELLLSRCLYPMSLRIVLPSGRIVTYRSSSSSLLYSNRNFLTILIRSIQNLKRGSQVVKEFACRPTECQSLFVRLRDEAEVEKSKL